MRLSTDSDEGGNIYDDQTDPGNATSELPVHLEEPSDSTVNASSDSTSPVSIVTRSSDVIPSDQDQRSSTKTTIVQQKSRQSQQQKCPYFMRSLYQEDNHIDRIQEDTRHKGGSGVIVA